MQRRRRENLISNEKYFLPKGIFSKLERFDESRETNGWTSL